jgi:hypothetical protein
MKYLCLLLFNVKVILSYLKLDIVEAINLHCLENNEFYCNPYASIKFKYKEDTMTTRQISCTKSPKWESSFTFDTDFCDEIVTIQLYQHITQQNKSYLGDSNGYLGEVEIDLGRLNFGVTDGWFMVNAPVDNSRVMFPSCIRLSITYTSTTCNNIPNMDSNLSMCKQDFVGIYRNKFSKLSVEDINSTETPRCTMNPNEDYGNRVSGLSSIEETLTHRIIKLKTGEDINFEKLTSRHGPREVAVRSFKDFFEQECISRPDMTIERINNILTLNVRNNTDIDLRPESEDYPMILAHRKLDNVYKDALSQYNTVEVIKHLDMIKDEEVYQQSLDVMVKTINQLDIQQKIDATVFLNKNRVALTSYGTIDPREEGIFHIFALYKWNGGHLTYEEIKREYMLRKKYFHCYETVKMIPTNVVFQFVEGHCPDNYVCLDPNGIVKPSESKDPRKVFELSHNSTKPSELSTLFSIENNLSVNYTIQTDTYYNKFDILYYQRQAKIQKKKERNY